jgi:hypothetical protein
MSTPHHASTVSGLPAARESAKSWAIRALLNRLPSYRRAGGKIIFISDDLTVARVRVKHNWLTYGQKGAIFGGSLYASIDPCYVIMLQWRLGRRYAVWDKSAAIEFKKAARSTLYADIVCSDDDLVALRAEADSAGRAERTFHIDLVDAGGVVHASCTKTLVIKQRESR